jgi:hypothetical protein
MHAEFDFVFCGPIEPIVGLQIERGAKSCRPSYLFTLSGFFCTILFAVGESGRPL